MENHVTMELSDTNERVWRPIKCELISPSVDWGRSWSLAHVKGLSSEQYTFLFCMLHNILPTNARLHRMNQRDSLTCSLCITGAYDDLVHY